MRLMDRDSTVRFGWAGNQFVSNSATFSLETLMWVRIRSNRNKASMLMRTAAGGPDRNTIRFHFNTRTRHWCRELQDGTRKTNGNHFKFQSRYRNRQQRSVHRGVVLLTEELRTTSLLQLNMNRVKLSVPAESFRDIRESLGLPA
ncbi:hypothetical protein GOODEAATRI_034374 [Goodea atripinnis]|uniref:Uncharacterized protein n=1 Tax=Goodea atripinnis TaxID=208336 RepID=A0ABV0NQH8_9TELE